MLGKVKFQHKPDEVSNHPSRYVYANIKSQGAAPRAKAAAAAFFPLWAASEGSYGLACQEWPQKTALETRFGAAPRRPTPPANVSDQLSPRAGPGDYRETARCDSATQRFTTARPSDVLRRNACPSEQADHPRRVLVGMWSRGGGAARRRRGLTWRAAAVRS